MSEIQYPEGLPSELSDHRREEIKNQSLQFLKETQAVLERLGVAPGVRKKIFVSEERRGKLLGAASRLALLTEHKILTSPEYSEGVGRIRALFPLERNEVAGSVLSDIKSLVDAAISDLSK